MSTKRVCAAPVKPIMHLSLRRFACPTTTSPSVHRPCADSAKRASQIRSYSIHVHIRSCTQVARPLSYASGPLASDSPTAGGPFRRLLLAVVAVGMGAASVAVVDKAGRGQVQLRTHQQFAKMSVSYHRCARNAPASRV